MGHHSSWQIPQTESEVPWPQAGHFKHLVIRDSRKLPCVAADIGVGRVDAIDIGVDLTEVGFQSGPRRRPRVVSEPPRPRVVILFFIGTLKPCYHHNNVQPSDRCESCQSHAGDTGLPKALSVEILIWNPR